MHKLRTGLALAVVVAVGWLLIDKITSENSDARSGSAIEADVEIGDVILNKTDTRTDDIALSYVITIYNHGDLSIVIDRIAAGCDCTNLEPSQLVVAPKSHGSVRATVATRRDELVTYEDSFVVLRGYLSGRVDPAFAVRLPRQPPRSLDVYPTSLLYETKKIKGKTIRCNPVSIKTPVQGAELRVVSGPNTQCEVETNGHGWLMQAAYTPPHDGSEPEEVELVLIDKSKDVVLDVRRLRCNPTYAGDTRVIPSQHDWGVVESGSWCGVDVKLIDGSGNPIDAVNWSKRSGVRITRARGVGTFRVEMLAASGYQKQQLTFEAVPSDGPLRAVTLTLEAYGDEMARR